MVETTAGKAEIIPVGAHVRARELVRVSVCLKTTTAGLLTNTKTPM